MLLDTHTALWAVGEVDRLSSRARTILEDASQPAFVSVASLWEVAIKSGVGKLRVDGDLAGSLAAAGFKVLPVTAEHAWATRDLPLHHRDPFDRLLVAVAREEGLDVLSADGAFDAYGVARVW